MTQGEMIAPPANAAGEWRRYWTLPIAAARIPICIPGNQPLDSRARLMSVRLRMKEVLIFENKAVLALNLAQAEVK